MSRRCEARVTAIAAMTQPEVISHWERERGEPAPAISPSLLARDLTFELQVAAHGGLDRRLARHLQRLCASAGDTARIPGPPTPGPGAGAQLLREWNGKTYKVIVTDDGGYLHDGQRYRSLSVIARNITGTRWSGPRFFGVPR